jgi:hypothetical protein
MLDDSERYKMMFKKLMVIFDKGNMKDTSFINSFMPRVDKKIKEGNPLSDREKEVIEELFDQN